MPLQELREGSQHVPWVTSLALRSGATPGGDRVTPGGDRAIPVLPWWGGGGLGGTLGTARGLLCWPQGWEGEQRNFWEAEVAGLCLLPNSLV